MLLIELLTKAGYLIEENSSISKEHFIQIHKFVVASYTFLIKSAASFDTIPSFIWNYSQLFFEVKWSNTRCNVLHLQLLSVLISRLGPLFWTYSSVVRVPKILLKYFRLLKDPVKKELLNVKLCSTTKKMRESGQRILCKSYDTVTRFLLSNSETIDDFIIRDEHRHFKIKVSKNKKRNLFAISSKSTKLGELNVKEDHSDDKKKKRKEKPKERHQRNRNLPILFKKQESKIDNVSHIALLNYFYEKITRPENKKRGTHRFIADRYEVEKIGFLNFIHKFLKYLEKTPPNYLNQHNVRYALSFILLLTEHHELMKDKEVKEMLYSDHAFDVLFAIITEEHNFNAITIKLRSMSYEILINLLTVDDKFTKETLEKWLSSPLKKAKYFNRVSNVLKILTTWVWYDDRKDEIEENTDQIDIWEVKHILTLFSRLCDNDEKWQLYWKTQNSISNCNLVDLIFELLGSMILNLKYKYCLDIAIQWFKFFYAFVNGNKLQKKKFTLNTRILNYIQDVIQIGYFGDQYYQLDLENIQIDSKEIEELNEKASVQISLNDQANENSKSEDKKAASDESNQEDINNSKSELAKRKNSKENTARDIDPIENDEFGTKIVIRQFDPSLTFPDNRKINELKYEALRLANLMLNEKLFVDFSFIFKKKMLASIIKFGYMFIKVNKNSEYSSHLFDDPAISNNYSIMTIFQAYYLHVKLETFSRIREYNIIHMRQFENRYHKFRHFLSHILFRFKRVNKIEPTPKLYLEDINSLHTKQDAMKFFEAHSSHVEVLLADGETIETVFFEIDPMFLHLSNEDKEKFWISADTEDAKAFCLMLLNYSLMKVEELHIQKQVQSSRWWMQNCTNRSNWLTDVLQTLIILINLLILLGYESDDLNSFDSPTPFGLSPVLSGLIMYPLAIMIMLGLIYFMIIQMTIAFRLRPVQVQDITSSLPEQSKLQTTFLYISTLRKRSIWSLMICILFCMLGLIVNFYWFSGWILFIISYNKEIMEVLRAVWQPKWRIIVTFLMVILIMYLYAVISFVMFENDFKKNIEDSCQNIFGCFIVIFDSWYKDGLGGFLSEESPATAEDGTYKARWGRIIFDFMFFLIVPTLLINILSGIIIDNFAERRSNRDMIKQRQQSQCYICGVENIEIDDFDNHTKFRHNIWDYMYYIGYLKYMKSENLIDSTHSYAKNCVLNRKISWFPCWVETKDRTLRWVDLVRGVIDSKVLLERTPDTHNVEAPFQQLDPDPEQQNNEEDEKRQEEDEEEKS